MLASVFNRSLLWILVIVKVCHCQDQNKLTFSTGNFNIEVGRNKSLFLDINQPLTEDVEISFKYLFDMEFSLQETIELIDPLPNMTLHTTKGPTHIKLYIHARNAGHVVVGVDSNSSVINSSDTFVRITIEHSHALGVFINIIGWIYFLAWTVSFYPQLILDYKRKSVVGLNFDMVAYNLVGFLAYAIFNIGFTWIPIIEYQYRITHPYGINPVQANDIFFALHAFVITIVFIVQICIYERGSQRLSKTAMVLLSGMVLFAMITLLLAVGKTITWLRYIYFLSYIKLFVTSIKYIPQAYMNLVRKSTVGWSIFSVLLDFIGGFLSILQMVLLAYNNDDSTSLFGDPTKFGLGALSILFDIVFIFQHYVLYRNAPKYTPLRTC